MGIKGKIKNALGYDTEIINSDFDEKNFCDSLKRFVDNNPEIMEDYSVFGKRRDGKDYYPAIKKIEDGFKFLNGDLKVYDEKGFVPVQEIYTFRTGNAIKSKPFPMSKEFILRMAMSKILFRYPSIAGHVTARSHFVNYLIREGFKKEKEPGYDGIGIDNVVFCCSTTHGYNMVLDTILREEDVVLVTGPNYGLFAAMPERRNARVEVLDLSEEDDFYVNPKKLAERIDEINKDLKEKWEGKLSYTPRVVAFLNENPHNPLGKVMNKKNLDLLMAIGDICLEKGVFVIDDLIYRDITFDLDDLAFPLASIPKYFNNTITLMGLSKSYGLAGIRAGAIIAPIPICNGVQEKIFTTMDSIPVFQVWALAGAFNATNRRYKAARKYFPPLVEKYIYQFNLLKGLLEGVDKVDSKYRKRIIKAVNKYATNDKYKKVLPLGIKGVKIREKTEPESGFFARVDFTGVKNNKYGDMTIKTEADLVRHMYKTSKFKCIMGSNMSWPYEDEIISRFNFAIEPCDIIHNVEQLYMSLSEEFICVEYSEK